MLNKLMMGVALSALALSGAMAQSTPSTSTTPDKPAMSSPADSSGSMNNGSSSSTMDKSPTTGASSGSAASDSSTPSSTSTASSGAAGEAPTFVSTQNPDQYLSSKFEGTDVVGSDDKKIGDVSDILFDKEGKIEAYVISVGGFLGVGSKNVALAPSAFQVVKGKEGESDKLRLSMSQDQLKQAQNFEPYKAPQTTTGSAARPGAPSGMKPPSSTGR
jgi:hypothetical protein